jgi:hypothetical protein
MPKLLRACFGHWSGWAALACLALIVAVVVAVGFAPGWLALGLPVIGVIACLAPGTLPLLWLRREWQKQAPAKAVTDEQSTGLKC